MYYKCLWSHWYAAAPELQASVATAEWDQESALFATPTEPFSGLNVGHRYCRRFMVETITPKNLDYKLP